MYRYSWILAAVIAVALAWMLWPRGSGPLHNVAPQGPDEKSPGVAPQPLESGGNSLLDGQEARIVDAQDGWTVSARITLDDALRGIGLEIGSAYVSLAPSSGQNIELQWPELRGPVSKADAQALLHKDAKFEAQLTVNLAGAASNTRLDFTYDAPSPKLDGTHLAFEITVSMDRVVEDYLLVAGRLLHPKGAPIANYPIRVEPPLASQSAEFVGTTDSQGRFVFYEWCHAQPPPRISGDPPFADPPSFTVGEAAHEDWMASREWMVLLPMTRDPENTSAWFTINAGKPETSRNRFFNLGEIVAPAAWVEFDASESEPTGEISSGSLGTEFDRTAPKLLLPEGVWQYYIDTVWHENTRVFVGLRGKVAVVAGQDQRVVIKPEAARVVEVWVVTKEGPLGSASISVRRFVDDLQCDAVAFADRLPFRLAIQQGERVELFVWGTAHGLEGKRVTVPEDSNSLMIELAVPAEQPSGVRIHADWSNTTEPMYWVIDSDGYARFHHERRDRGEHRLHFERPGTWTIYVGGGSEIGYPFGILAGPFTVETEAGRYTDVTLGPIPPPPWDARYRVGGWLTCGGGHVSVRGESWLLPGGAPGPDPSDFIFLYPESLQLGDERFPVRAVPVHAEARLRLEVELPPRLSITLDSSETKRRTRFTARSGGVEVSAYWHGNTVYLYAAPGPAEVTLWRDSDAGYTPVEVRQVDVPAAGTLDLHFGNEADLAFGTASFTSLEGQSLPGNETAVWQIVASATGSVVASAAPGTRLTLPAGEYVAGCMSRQAFGWTTFTVRAGSETGVMLEARHVPHTGLLFVTVPQDMGAVAQEANIAYRPTALEAIGGGEHAEQSNLSFRVLPQGLLIERLPAGLEITVTVRMFGATQEHIATFKATPTTQTTAVTPEWKPLSDD